MAYTNMSGDIYLGSSSEDEWEKIGNSNQGGIVVTPRRSKPRVTTTDKSKDVSLIPNSDPEEESLISGESTIPVATPRRLCDLADSLMSLNISTKSQSSHDESPHPSAQGPATNTIITSSTSGNSKRYEDESHELSTVTSTPLLSGRKMFVKPHDLNVTAIESSTSNLNCTAVTENSKCSEVDLTQPTGETTVVVVPRRNETVDLDLSSQLLKSLKLNDQQQAKSNFQQIHTKSTKQYPDIEEISEESVHDVNELSFDVSDSDSGDELVVLGAVGGSKRDQQHANYNRKDSSSPQYLEDIPRRVSPPRSKTNQKQPLIKFLPELPELSEKDPKERVNVQTAIEFKGHVQKTLGKLVEMLNTMPTPEDEEEDDVLQDLNVNLYTHQKYGLKWLLWKEQQFPGGGILADEMGLGKTIMMIALVIKSKSSSSKENSSSWVSSREKVKLVPSRATLVVCPPAVLNQWAEEIKMKTRGMRVTMFHGPKRVNSAAVLAQSDFVLTTYSTVGSEIPKPSEDKNNMCRSPLIRVGWERIILDEGHVIRNPTTLSAQAVSRLNARHRWVVTGTPVHNKPSDMYSLVKFLKMKPFDDKKVWEFWIGMKTVKSENAKRLHTIGKALILRRTKDEVQQAGGDVQSIPPKTVVDVMVELSVEEKQIYDHLYAFAESQFKMFLKSQGEKAKELQDRANNFVVGRPRLPSGQPDVNFTHVFTLLLRLRQASVLPFLIHTMLEDSEDDDLDTSAFDALNEDHLISHKNPVFDQSFKSAKIRHVLKDLNELREEAEMQKRPMDKVVIVSQWTTLLDIMRRHLQKNKYSTVSITGQQLLSERQESMHKLNNNPSRPQIMLLSLNAGGVGLNLIGANYLFFLDVHYNPQLELQAQDRIHRFGQTKNVTIRRYISIGTMEEMVINLQKQKLDLANGILTNTKKKSGTGLSVQEMRLLFGV